MTMVQILELNVLKTSQSLTTDNDSFTRSTTLCKRRHYWCLLHTIINHWITMYFY